MGAPFGSRVDRGHQAVPPSDESAAITAGAIARRTNDGKRARHERERQAYRKLAGLGLVEAPAGCAGLGGQLIEHGPSARP